MRLRWRAQSDGGGDMSHGAICIYVLPCGSPIQSCSKTRKNVGYISISCVTGGGPGRHPLFWEDDALSKPGRVGFLSCFVECDRCDEIQTICEQSLFVKNGNQTSFHGHTSCDGGETFCDTAGSRAAFRLLANGCVPVTRYTARFGLQSGKTNQRRKYRLVVL